MARKQGTKRKPAATRRPRKKPASKPSRVHWDHWWRKHWQVCIGFLLGGSSLLGIFKLGIVGVGTANLMRLLLGNIYLAGLLGLLLIGGWLIVGHPAIKIAIHYWIGLSLSVLGWLLFAAVLMFNEVEQRPQFLRIVWETWQQQFQSGQITADMGGGILGATLAAGLVPLISSIGCLFLGIFLVGSGILIFFDVPLLACSRFLVQLVSQTWHRLNNDWHQHQRNIRMRKAEVVEQPPRTKQSYTPKPTEQAQSAEPQPVIHRASPTDDVDEPDFVQHPQVQGDYQLPTTDLLTKLAPTDQSQEDHDIDKNTEILKQTLQSFGVDAQVKNVSLGPSVTEYEIHPAIGVKVSKIVNLSDDLALALAAKDIRIEAPIPGKSLIGIEVPNKEIATVSFRDVFEHQGQAAWEQLLSVPLGKDVNGNVQTCDLTKMPHLLIAGSTGSGKSVAINGFLTSILLKAAPSQVKLMLIDPKKVELGVYNGIPHLLSPVVSDPKKAARALNKVVAEMEKRYELFAKTGQRKISTYNQFIREKNEKEQTTVPQLPYIVVVVDELADLMMTVSNEVETAIIRLAQMGRAAGVHMILATQRPSVDVITGLIKANVPSRIAFAVSSGTDSRTILDANGAEKLLGRGDMLYQPIDQNKPVRIQGSFISDQDVEAVVKFVREQADPDYDEEMVVSDAELEAEDEAADQDPLFAEALAFVVSERKASTSMLQRRFRIGYNRAARIIDELEQRGYIGAQHGSTPRTVYKQPDDQS
ncbi:FtsK/SpoIIIE family DNA translocase [Fructilactobacillus florum]|uniref:DNA translocase FtsK n=1 Tax=Fructilactobacillus florum DSM 22689 = JCM 16035 TaxID=1423745 RepID=A0A0R2CUG0_9LACO|nr:DNA translocase FtsK [Fructilactobacillus florum]KRM91638.1 DNA translocase FtsK [Fructilactobacillus florum DSM 22689 = JCM 16035]